MKKIENSPKRKGILEKMLACALLVGVLFSGCNLASEDTMVSQNTVSQLSNNSSEAGQPSEPVQGDEVVTYYAAPTVQEDRILAEATKSVTDGIVIPEYTVETRSIPETEIFTFVSDMRIGWNLGNTLDAVTDGEVTGAGLALENAWCGAVTTQEMIDAVKAAGFHAVRIPVSWHNHIGGPNHEIRERWMDRVQEVVDYAYRNGMYVIINIHHDIDKRYYYPSSEYLESSTHYMECIWSQISERFQDYGERLIFESVNEPRLVGTSYEWNLVSGNAECEDAVNCINALNQTFVDTVRASGGNNATRYLMVPGYAASVDGALHESFVLPTDTIENHLMVSTHAYTPYDFALQDPNGANGEFSQAGEESVDWIMNALYERYVSQGIPVIMGEFGARNKDNLQERVDFSAYYIAKAKECGIVCFWWDNNAFWGEGEMFGLFDRMAMNWVFGDILDAMMRQLD